MVPGGGGGGASQTGLVCWGGCLQADHSPGQQWSAIGADRSNTGTLADGSGSGKVCCSHRVHML